MSNVKLLSLCIFTFLGAVILISLCAWQIQRSDWKTALIAQIEAEYSRDPFSVQLNLDELGQAEEQDEDIFIHSGYVTGKFVNSEPVYWPKTHDGNLGFYVSRFFEANEGQLILVNLGWVYEDPISHQPLDDVRINMEREFQVGGIARKYEASFMSLDNNLQENRWYQFDRDQLQRYANISQEPVNFMFFVKDIKPLDQHKLGELIGAEIYPRNKHHEYAWFWGVMFLLWCCFMGKLIHSSINKKSE